MLATPSMQPSERRLSEIDRYCIQAEEVGKALAARRLRYAQSTIGILCLALLAGLLLAMWQASAVAQERDALALQLRTERAERIRATLAASDAEMSAATHALDTRVRSDLIDERLRAALAELVPLVNRGDAEITRIRTSA